MATVEVRVGGVDITDHVQWSSASFMAKVNGSIGECSFRVLDRTHALSFRFGQEIELRINGVLRWGGWVLRPERGFLLPTVLSPATFPRIWDIEGVDFNMVFDKRVLHDADPAKVWDYDPGTYDDTIINDIWPNFDMAGFTKDITRVGVGVLDIPGVTAKGLGGKVAAGGYRLRDVMASLSRNTAALYYCSPSKVVTYLDSDAVNSDYALTDQPSGGFDIGYREAKIREDGTEMDNDAMVWGAGYGGPNIVFSRHEDATSQMAHGRWQKGQFTSGIYKQATADAIALSYVEGSPAAHRAAKFPKRSVECVVWDPVFGVGDVVNFHNSSFLLPTDPPSHDDVLPIRQMGITFPTPNNPRFALLLSWEIDAAWSFYDPWIPLNPGPPPPFIPVTPPAPCVDVISPCDCGITDAFGRVVADGLGDADCGITWEPYAGSIWSVSPGVATAFVVAMADNNFSAGTLRLSGRPTSTITAKGQITTSDGPSVDEIWYLGVDLASGDFAEVDFSTDGTVSLYTGSDPGTAYATLGFTATTPFNVRLSADGDAKAKIWRQGDPEPDGWTVTVPFVAPTYTIDYDLYVGISTFINTSITGTFSMLDAVGVNRCTAVQFDNFRRLIASGLGVSTPSSFIWTGGGIRSVVTDPDLSYGRLNVPQTIYPSHGGSAFGDVPIFDGVVPPLTWTFKISFPSPSTVSANYVSPTVGNHDPFINLSIGAGSGGLGIGFTLGQAGFTPNSRTVNFGANGVDETRFSWSPDTNSWYNVELAWGTDLELRIWLRGAERPTSPTGTASIVGADPWSGSPSLHVEIQNAGPTTGYNIPFLEAHITDIDFDYPGKPCFSCPTFKDDFERVVPSGWGRSTSGSDWSEPFAPSHVAVSVGNIGAVTGSTGNLVAEANQFGTAFIEAPILQGLASPWEAAWSVYADPVDWVGGSYTLFTSVIQDRSLTADGTPNLVQILQETRPDGVHISLMISNEADVCSPTGTTEIALSEPGGNITFYRLRFEGTNVRLKAWVYGTAEPESWGLVAEQVLCGNTVIADVAAALAASADNHIAFLSSTGPTLDPSPYTFEVDGIDFGGEGCHQPVTNTCVDPATPPTNAIGQRACDQLVPLGVLHSVDQHFWYLAGSQWKTVQAAYIPGSALLAINGLQQFGDYVEISPIEGIITINFDVRRDDIVTLCYLTNGALP